MAGERILPLILRLRLVTVGESPRRVYKSNPIDSMTLIGP